MVPTGNILRRQEEQPLCQCRRPASGRCERTNKHLSRLELNLLARRALSANAQDRVATPIWSFTHPYRYVNVRLRALYQTFAIGR